MPVVKPHGAISQGFDVSRGVRYEKYRNAARPQLMNFTHAALAEVDVAYGEGFIHEQDFGIDVNRNGKGEPDHHSGGIGFGGTVDEFADLGKGFDLRKPAVHILAG